MHGPDVAEDYKRAGERIDAVRLRRGLTQGEAADAAGVSSTSWNVVVNGRSAVSPRTAAKIMTWCGWTPESYQRLLDGQEPEPLTTWSDIEQLGATGPRSSPSRSNEGALGPRGDPPPAGYGRRWPELSPSERAKVEAFIDGLLANRDSE